MLIKNWCGGWEDTSAQTDRLLRHNGTVGVTRSNGVPLQHSLLASAEVRAKLGMQWTAILIGMIQNPMVQTNCLFPNDGWMAQRITMILLVI